MGSTNLPKAIRDALASELNELRSELGGVGWGRVGPLLDCSGEIVRRASLGGGGPQVLEGLLKHRSMTLEQLLDKHGVPTTGVARAMVGESRYGARDQAIRTHVRYGEHPEDAVRQAADAVAVGLESEDDPGERWWYEQIDAELKRRRKGKPRLGERVSREDDE